MTTLGVSARPGKSLLMAMLAMLALLGGPMAHAQSRNTIEVDAITDTSCAGTRAGATRSCTSNDFTAIVSFAQVAEQQLDSCLFGEELELAVDAEIQSGNSARYDIGIFFGQESNPPRLNNAAAQCSLGVVSSATLRAGTFPPPSSPSTFPFVNTDSDACADFSPLGAPVQDGFLSGQANLRVYGIKATCKPAPNSNLVGLPYTLVFDNRGNDASCTVATMTAGTNAKCDSVDDATVAGLRIFGYVKVTKATQPSGAARSFSFRATANGPDDPIPNAFNLLDGEAEQIVAVLLDEFGGTRQLVIEEDLAEPWGPGASITCTTPDGGSAASFVTIDNANRRITANLDGVNGAAECVVTNTRQTRVRTNKVIDPVDDDGRFSLSAGGVTVDDQGHNGTTGYQTVTADSSQTFSEAGFGATSLTDYLSSYECVRDNDVTVETVATGTGTSVTLTAAVHTDTTCTFTNRRGLPELTLEKFVENGAPYSAVDDVIDYRYLVTNTGNLRIEDLVVTDDLIATVTCPRTALEPGESMICTGSHVVTQGDLDNGSVTNYAEANGVPPFGNLEPAAASATATAIQNAAMELVKSAPAGTMAVGEALTYTITATNTGNVTVTDAEVTDALLTPASTACASLAPGGTCVLVGDYVVQQADMDAGELVNTADASGVDPTAALVTASDTITTLLPRNPSLSIAKADPIHVDNDGSGTVTINDLLTYTITATNSGNATLHDVIVSDSQITPDTESCGALAPDATCVLIGTRLVVLADVAAGEIVNIASAVADETGEVTASVTTMTSVLPLIANNDGGVIASGAIGGEAVPDVLWNDTLNGVVATLATVDLTQMSTTSANVTLSAATGAVHVAPATTAGTYTLVYRICERLNPGNCATATVTVVVSARILSGLVLADNGDGGGVANDGQRNGDEIGLANVTVRLTNCDAIDHAVTSTDGDGRYRLAIPDSLADGATLCVVQTNLPGYTSTGAHPGNTGGSYDRDLDRMQFQLSPAITYTDVVFGDVSDNRFLTDGSRTAPPGTTVSFPHAFIAGTAGQVDFSTSAVASPEVSGWSEVLYRDAACDGELNSAVDEQLQGAVAVGAGERVCLIVQQFVPASAPPGASNLVTVQAFFVYANAAPALTALHARQDVTITSDSALLLVKNVRNVTQNGPWAKFNAAASGDVLEYQISYTNTGTTDIGELAIRDMTPAFTTFVTASCGPALPPLLTSCNVLAPAAGQPGAITWEFLGLLQPARSATISFQVQVD